MRRKERFVLSQLPQSASGASDLHRTSSPVEPMGHGRLVWPFRMWNPASLKDRPHGSKRQRPTAMIRYDHLFPGSDVSPLLWLPDWPTNAKSCCLKTLATSSAVRRGVPCSPNRDLGQLGSFRQRNLGRREVEPDRLFDVRSGLFFGKASRSASGQLRAERRVTIGICVELQHNAKLHVFSVGPRLGPRVIAILLSRAKRITHE